MRSVRSDGDLMKRSDEMVYYNQEEEEEEEEEEELSCQVSAETCKSKKKEGKYLYMSCN